MPVHLQFPDNITDSLPTTCGCPSSAENGTSIRYFCQDGRFPESNGTSVRYWTILADFPSRE